MACCCLLYASLYFPYYFRPIIHANYLAPRHDSVMFKYNKKKKLPCLNSPISGKRGQNKTGWTFPSIQYIIMLLNKNNLNSSPNQRPCLRSPSFRSRIFIQPGYLVLWIFKATSQSKVFSDESMFILCQLRHLM